MLSHFDNQNEESEKELLFPQANQTVNEKKNSKVYYIHKYVFKGMYIMYNMCVYIMFI